MKKEIKLETIEDVKNFCNDMNKISCDVTVSNKKYIVDAKSIMGICSLNAYNGLIVVLADNAGNDDKFYFENLIERYEVR